MILNKIIFVLSILILPYIDIIRMLLRLIEKKSPFEADKKHIHHLVLKWLKATFLQHL